MHFNSLTYRFISTYVLTLKIFIYPLITGTLIQLLPIILLRNNANNNIIGPAAQANQ